MRRGNRNDDDYGDYMRDQQKDRDLQAQWALERACPVCPAKPGEQCKFTDPDNDADLFGFHPRRVP